MEHVPPPRPEARPVRRAPSGSSPGWRVRRRATHRKVRPCLTPADARAAIAARRPCDQGRHHGYRRHASRFLLCCRDRGKRRSLSLPEPAPARPSSRKSPLRSHAKAVFPAFAPVLWAHEGRRSSTRIRIRRRRPCLPPRFCSSRPTRKVQSTLPRHGGWNPIDDARALSQEPRSDNSTAQPFRKAPAWIILFDHRIQHRPLIQGVAGERDDGRNGLRPITISVLRLLDPNSCFGFLRIDIVKSCGTNEF